MPAKILVVDDEIDIELLVRQQFRKQIRLGELEFIFASNGVHALEKLDADNEIHVVLTDLNMPVMDGLMLLSRIGGLSRIVKVVIVSAYGDMQNIRKAMNLGAFDFLTKPIDFGDFAITVDKTLEQAKLLLEAQKNNQRLTAIRQFFSPGLAEQLERGPDLLEGRNQEVTVLVSDLRGFSTLAERLGPQQICRLIRDMMERLSKRIVENDGVIVDYAGDGILAMWNAPLPQESHALLACRAALAMQAEMPGLAAAWADSVGGPLVLGIGLNTGVAQVGNTGSTHKFKYGPHGHAVNVASRVQGQSKHLRAPLLITAATRNRLPSDFPARRLGCAYLSGIATPVELHELPVTSHSHAWAEYCVAYETALATYEAGRFGEAFQALLTLSENRQDAGDIPLQVLLRRARDYMSNPPATFDAALDWSAQALRLQSGSADAAR